MNKTIAVLFALFACMCSADALENGQKVSLKGYTNFPLDISNLDDSRRVTDTMVRVDMQITLTPLTEAQICEGPYTYTFEYTMTPYYPDRVKNVPPTDIILVFDPAMLDAFRAAGKPGALFLGESGKVEITVNPPAHAKFTNLKIGIMNRPHNRLGILGFSRHVAGYGTPFCLSDD